MSLKGSGIFVDIMFYSRMKSSGSDTSSSCDSESRFQEIHYGEEMQTHRTFVQKKALRKPLKIISHPNKKYKRKNPYSNAVYFDLKNTINKLEVSKRIHRNYEKENIDLNKG